jgi:hypothetical protein
VSGEVGDGIVESQESELTTAASVYVGSQYVVMLFYTVVSPSLMESGDV